MTNSRRLKTVPSLSDLYLHGQELSRCICFRYLGYQFNHRLSDDDTLRRQASRLYAIANNLAADLPLYLLDDSRLRKLACAYGNVYMLPLLTDSTAQSYQKLKTAHRYFITTITQYKKRETENWDTIKNIPRPENRFIYGRLRIPTLETMKHNQALGFSQRFNSYVSTLRRDPSTRSV